MPFAMNAPFLTRGAEGLDRRGFTVADVFRLIEAGVIDPNERFELIEGEIAPMAPDQSRHVVIKSRLARLLTHALFNRTDVLVVPDSTLYLSRRSFVEPDIYIVPDTEDAARTPAADILLVIEVAASTGKRDLDLKAALYARAGVTEYWVVDADSLVTTLHLAPVEGAYARIETARPDQALTPERLGAVSVRLRDIATPR